MKYLKSSLLFSGGFAGGLLVGSILSHYKNPDAFQHQKERTEIAIRRFNAVVKQGTDRLREINTRVKYEFTHPIPDLYRATEGLSLDENELIYE